MITKPTPEAIADSQEFKEAMDFLRSNKLLRIIADDQEVIRLLGLCGLPAHVKHPTRPDCRKCLMFAPHEDKSYVFCLWFNYDSQGDNGYSAMEFNREFLSGVTQTDNDRYAMMLLISGCLGFHLEEIGDPENWTSITKNWTTQN